MAHEFDRLPIITLWNVILVPLQGEVTDALAERLRENVLEVINHTGAEGLIIDVTGVWVIDSHLCSVIGTLASSASLMGTRSIICGMSADIALTLLTMDVDLGKVKTALMVEEAFALLDIRPIKEVRPAKQPTRWQEEPLDGCLAGPVPHRLAGAHSAHRRRREK